MRNPGYGHPLRPEYVLTPRGFRLPACVRLVEALQRLDFEDGGLKKWSIPVLLELAGSVGSRNSRGARDQPAGVDAGPKELADAGLVERRVQWASRRRRAIASHRGRGR